eukprot:jgi/Tetstr1/436154/TSEL_025000.t1
MAAPASIALFRAAALFCLLCALMRTGTAEDEQQELPNFKKMKVKELRALLEDRGVECRGCAEKADLVARVEETYHLPLKPRTEWKGPASGGGKKRSDGVPDMDDPEVAELVRKLQSQMKGNGMGDSFKMFTGKDFEGLSPEEMQKKFDGEL